GGAAVQRLVGGSGAAADPTRLCAGPCSGPLAQVSVVRDGPGSERRTGGERAAPGPARGRLPFDAAAGAMDQRRVGMAAGGAPRLAVYPVRQLHQEAVVGP